MAMSYHLDPIFKIRLLVHYTLDSTSTSPTTHCHQPIKYYGCGHEILNFVASHE
jgi:hypothetical protein